MRTRIYKAGSFSDKYNQNVLSFGMHHKPSGMLRKVSFRQGFRYDPRAIHHSEIKHRNYFSGDN